MQQTLISLSKVTDVLVLSLLVVFFLGFLAFDHELLGIHEQIISIPHEMEVYFELIPWIILIILIIDLWLKYLIAGKDLRAFLQHYWFDIFMAALIPLLLPLKFFKVTFKLFKIIKAGKFGYKTNQKVGNIRKHFFSEGETSEK